MENLIIRELSEKDTKEVQLVDELSGGFVSEIIDIPATAYGMFDGDILIGYCSIGGADEYDFVKDQFDDFTPDCWLISDVFISPQYRGKRLGLKLIERSIELKKEYEEELPKYAFLAIIYGGLAKYYKQIGFEDVYTDLGFSYILGLKLEQ